MDLTSGEIDSSIGPLWLAADGPILCALLFDDDLPALFRRHYPGAACRPGRLDAAIVTPLAAYFAGEISALDRIAVATPGTAFQRLVWAALRAIPAGQTTSYGALAAAIGRPSAVRAVGLANGANPISLVVPCHRVIGTDGTLTGYGGGLHRKAWLLRHEGAARLTANPQLVMPGLDPGIHRPQDRAAGGLPGQARQ